MKLPGRFFNSRNLAFVRKFSETNTAKIKVPHKTPSTATLEATMSSPSAELGDLF